MTERIRELSGSLSGAFFYKGTNPIFIKVTPSLSSHLPKVPPLDTIILGFIRD